MIKKLLLAILTAIIICLPFLALLNGIFSIPEQYGKTFLAELAPKYERLMSLEGEKIIVVGGSSVAFGLDSEKLSEYTKKPCVNFGLYATLGTKVMLDLARDGIKKGDIVVICPETDAQTYSLYTNGEALWQAIDSNKELFFSLSKRNFPTLLSSAPSFYFQKRNFHKNSDAPNPKGIYKKDSFNELGDISIERSYNIMPKLYDSTSVISPTQDIVTDEYIDYVNSFINYAKLKGAVVYYSFSPMNLESMDKNLTEDDIFLFANKLSKELNCEVISDIRDYILEGAYFFDTNFHLNDKGVAYRTSLLAKDILRAEGSTENIRSLYFPSAPDRPDDLFESGEVDDMSGFFEYEKTEGGLSLCGITELGKNEARLIIPSSFEGEPILSISKNAFSGCEKLTSIVIGSGTSLRSLENGCFSGAPLLTRVEISVAPQNVKIGAEVFTDTAEGFAFYVPRAMYGDFVTDYVWSPYGEYIKLAD